MRRSFYAILALSSCWCQLCHGGSSAEVQERFQREYPGALQKLLAVYARLVIEAQFEPTNANTASEAARGLTMRCMTRGDSVRLITFPSQSPLGEADPKTSVSVAHPRVSFSLTRAVERDGFSVARIGDYEGRLAGIRIAAWPLFAPYCIHELTVQDWCCQPRFRWRRFVLLEGEEELVRAEWVDEDPEYLTAGWFLFAPKSHWALRGWRLDRSDKPGDAYREAEIEYFRGRSIDGVPLVAAVTYGVRVVGQPEPLYEHRWRITRIEPADVPEAAFTLPAFGLPDVAPEIDPRRRMRWILLAGIAAIAVAPLLAWLRSRRARRLAPAA